MAGRQLLQGEHLQTSLEMLETITCIFDQHQLPYWLEGGTLLGIVREQRLLPWDNDVDLSIRSQDMPSLQRCLPALKRAGYRIRIKPQLNTSTAFTAGEPRIAKVRNRRLIFFRGDALVDIFIKYKHVEHYYWVIGRQGKLVTKHCPACFYDDLDRIDFNGKAYSAPRDAEAYLAYRYGDWRSPVQKWNTFADDLAVLARS